MTDPQPTGSPSGSPSGSYGHGSSKRLDFPLPDVSWPELARFWAGAAVGELHLPFCVGCEATRWYPTGTCLCGEAATVWRRLSGRATVFAYTVVRHVFLPQYRDLVPFVAALVEPDDAPGARLATRLIDCAGEDVHCDMAVAVRFEPLMFAGVEGSVMAPVFAPTQPQTKGSV
jgi:uncharacterized protein